MRYVKQLYDDVTFVSRTDFYEIGKNYHQSETEVMRFDLRMVRESDIVLVNLKDLHSSLGTSDEILYAFISGKPVIGFIEDKEEVKEKFDFNVVNDIYDQTENLLQTGELITKRAQAIIKEPPQTARPHRHYISYDKYMEDQNFERTIRKINNLLKPRITKPIPGKC